MEARPGEPGDAARTRPLLDAALAHFRSLGMPGWTRRAEALGATLATPETVEAVPTTPTLAVRRLICPHAATGTADAPRGRLPRRFVVSLRR
jgi:hypothetical protein